MPDNPFELLLQGQQQQQVDPFTLLQQQALQQQAQPAPNEVALQFAMNELAKSNQDQVQMTQRLDSKIEEGKDATTVKNALSSFDKLQELFSRQ